MPPAMTGPGPPERRSRSFFSAGNTLATHKKRGTWSPIDVSCHAGRLLWSCPRIPAAGSCRVSPFLKMRGKEPWKAARPDSAFRVVQGPSPFARSPGRRQRSKGLPPLQKHAPSKGEKHNINKLFQLDRQHPNISPVKGLPQVQRSSEKARRGKDGSVGE